MGSFSYFQPISVAHAQEFIVVNSVEDSEDPDGFCTLREAIRATQNKDMLEQGETPRGVARRECNFELGNNTITFLPTLFSTSQTIYIQKELTIKSNIAISGSGASKLKLYGSGANRIFNIDSRVQVTLTGLTIENGRATVGGGIYNMGNLVINQSILRDNVAIGNADRNKNDGDGYGGGIYNMGNLVINQSTVRDNQAIGQAGSSRSAGVNLRIVGRTGYAGRGGVR